MKSIHKSKFAGIFVVITALGLLTANPTAASAVTKKSITCYKGKVIKKVTAVKPVCPKGWTSKKPVVKPSVKPSTTPTKASGGVLAFSGAYKGKMSVLWSDSGVQATSVTASGTGTTLGLDSLSGTGSSSPQNQCDSIDGSGVLSGGGNTIKVSFDSNAKGCAAEGAAPTTVTITGTASINGGTGKYAGATGTLKVTGSFAIKSNAAGFGETTVLSLTIVGNINTK
jgi:hypothetical protein